MPPISRERYLAKLQRLKQLSFEQRLLALFDPDTCTLLSAADWDEAWGQAVVTARGLVDGRPVLAYASNFLIEEGTIGAAEVEAIVGVLAEAAETRTPVVALLQSNGARVSERHEALKANAHMFAHVTRLSGAVPQLMASMGLCLGVAAYLVSLADFAWVIPGQSYTATSSPAVIKVATGRSCGFEELGGAAMHTETSGVAAMRATDDAACLAEIRRFLGAIHPAVVPALPPTGAPLATVVPEVPHRPYDVHALIEALVDGQSFLETHAGWGRSMVTGFARIGGRAAGIVANQSQVRSGALDVEAIRKASRFLQAADAYGVPLLYLVDVPGIMVSPDEEQNGILAAGGVLFHAVDTDVPRIALVVRKCYGGAFVMLQARQAGGDRVLALPGAMIDIAGAEATFAILHGKTHQTHPEAAAYREATLRDLRERRSDAETALAEGIIDAIVAPAEARTAIIAALTELADKRPPKRVARRRPNWQV